MEKVRRWCAWPTLGWLKNRTEQPPELEKVFCRWIYFHLRSEISGWDAVDTSQRQ